MQVLGTSEREAQARAKTVEEQRAKEANTSGCELRMCPQIIYRIGTIRSFGTSYSNIFQYFALYCRYLFQYTWKVWFCLMFNTCGSRAVAHYLPESEPAKQELFRAIEIQHVQSRQAGCGCIQSHYLFSGVHTKTGGVLTSEAETRVLTSDPTNFGRDSKEAWRVCRVGCHRVDHRPSNAFKRTCHHI